MSGAEPTALMQTPNHRLQHFYEWCVSNRRIVHQVDLVWSSLVNTYLLYHTPSAPSAPSATFCYKIKQSGSQSVLVTSTTLNIASRT
ncbi:hypothetical protein E2C01_088487 [Portunus trituberculatus]|uniref:Uncharacterized protein n=1 Tax=Portunus trituberculatus TaxID=210409 RepID=A0A5B7JAW9_PORTR|nr:hypothetical protein [Portunus trituberculatus]